MKSIKYIFILCILISQILKLHSQNIPPSRITNWNSPGCLTVFNYQNIVILSAFGADTSGVLSCNSALQQAINALNGAGKVYIPKGSYFFDNSINLPDSIILEGETDTLTNKPLAVFKLSSGNSNHGIIISGNEINIGYSITYQVNQGEQKIYVSQPQLFNIGDFIKITPNDDSLLVNNSWAYHTTGQIFQIINIEGDSLFLNKPVRRSYTGNNLPQIYKLIPRRQVHIKCIEIKRIDTTINQSANIYIQNAADCSISGLRSYYCNFAHIDIRNSTRITIENSFFKDAISYGSDGKGYGIMLQSTSGDCYIHQNNFDHLRHSMIMQSGANGNVLAYNYSRNPYWTGTLLPANSSGDLVLHGNYVYMNLIEGNVVQNIVIDNSHGINGPYNTFFRNRAELYGIFMNNSPASNAQNFIGNQVTNTSSIFLGLYSLQGNNHFQYGNMILGNITPASTYEPSDTTMFNYTFNSFYKNIATIPPVKSTNWNSQLPLIEANYRFLISDKKAICNEIFYQPTKINEPFTLINDEYEIFPNPFTNYINIINKNFNANYKILIYNILGKIIYDGMVNSENQKIIINHLKPGIYFLHIDGNKKLVFKIVKE